MYPSHLMLQDWRCIDCTKAIGALFGNGKVCAFTKKHYCDDCHVDDMAVIPPRLLYNWDAKPYPVARTSLRFLTAVSGQPIINLGTFNPHLVDFAPVIDLAARKRQKLVYLIAYISACARAGDTEQKIGELLRGRAHLYADSHWYAIGDLEELHRGELMEALQRAVRCALGHVDGCLVCAGRGFICELCQVGTLNSEIDKVLNYT